MYGNFPNDTYWPNFLLPTKIYQIDPKVKHEMDSSETTKAQSNDKQFYQNVIVMRHGDRADNFEPLWVSTAARPWDPHIVEEGRVRAFCTGRRLRANLGFPIRWRTAISFSLNIYFQPLFICLVISFLLISFSSLRRMC